MNKIGIINELSLDTVNFGNNLQAYAINRYLSMQYPDFRVHTIVVDTWEKRRYASTFHFLWYGVVRKVLAKCKHLVFPAKKLEKIEERFQIFSGFSREYINIDDTIKSWHQLENSDYDFFIVGSDVVWFQWKGYIRRTKFLDFQNRENAVKISYAASFGNRVVPHENRKLIRNCLADFKAVSVRERSAIDLLATIGIQDAVYVCDPTILLGREEWEKIEQPPTTPGSNLAYILNQKKFCFVYLLGNDTRQRDSIERLCRREKLLLVTVPYVLGYKDETDCFGDIQVELCSPQEWIWLIHHAEYVITDSFHGLAFSTIFSTKFVVVRRMWALDLNIRLEDYLSYLDETDKYLDIHSVQTLGGLSWDFGKIQDRVTKFAEESKSFILRCIE